MAIVFELVTMLAALALGFVLWPHLGDQAGTSAKAVPPAARAKREHRFDGGLPSQTGYGLPTAHL